MEPAAEPNACRERRAVNERSAPHLCIPAARDRLAECAGRVPRAPGAVWGRLLPPSWLDVLTANCVVALAGSPREPIRLNCSSGAETLSPRIRTSIHSRASPADACGA